MKSFSSHDFKLSLKKVNIHPGDTIFVHSSLFQLGMLEGFQAEAMPAELVRMLLEYLGNKGTLVVPTFNFGFSKGMPFDRQHSTSEGMGILSEYVRNMPESIRSRHPLQSISAVGRFAEEITSPNTDSSFDIGGPFNKMIDLGAKLLLLGASIQSASLIHYVEERVEVPYRYWKTFKGIYVDNGVKEERTYKFFARDLELDPRLNLYPIERWLKERNQFYKVPLGNGKIVQCTFSDFFDVVHEHLKNDPYCLVKSIKKKSVE